MVGLGFGNKSEIIKKILTQKANSVRLQQQHYKFQLLQSKQTNQIAKASYYPVLDERKPPPVPTRPRVLKREDVNKLSYCEMETWLNYIGLIAEGSKAKQQELLLRYLEAGRGRMMIIKIISKKVIVCL